MQHRRGMRAGACIACLFQVTSHVRGCFVQEVRRVCDLLPWAMDRAVRRRQAGVQVSSRTHQRRQSSQVVVGRLLAVSFVIVRPF